MIDGSGIFVKRGRYARSIGSGGGWHSDSSFWGRLYDMLCRVLKVYAFLLVMFTLMRMAFIIGLNSYMAQNSGMADVLHALWRGARLSMQSTGVLVLPFIIAGLVFFLISKRVERAAFKVIAAAEMTALSVLFVASFPFYRTFRSGFNQMVFIGANEDWTALFWTMMKEYWLPVRLVVALLLAYVLWRMLMTFLDHRIGPELPRMPIVIRYVGRLAFLYMLYLLGLLSVYGGSLGWQTGVNWENAGETKDDFLNEAILDDVQMLYRGYEINHRNHSSNGLDFTAADVKRLAANLRGMEASSDNLDTYLGREAPGQVMEKPRQVFVIIGESYASWPLIDKYAQLHIADPMKEIIAEDDTDVCYTLLPNGASTVSAMTGIVTGFADANLYLTTMEEAYAEPYPCASAPIMEELGYSTSFWYAGPATWESIGQFVRAQGYDSFHGRGDYGDVPGSVWGVDDASLYRAVLDGTPVDKQTFTVILNVSNHSPFTVDLEREGFPRERVRAALPEGARDDEELIKQLGHYWYESREMASFIKALKRKYPGCLIVAIGDHADRYNIEKNPAMYERYAVPCIITGAGVMKGMLPEDAAGSQIDVMPTIIDMIAPAGFRYLSIGQSLSYNKMGVNYGFWITHGAIGKTDVLPIEPYPTLEGEPGYVDAARLDQYIDAVRAVSWYRAKYGAEIDESKLVGR